MQFWPTVGRGSVKPIDPHASKQLSCSKNSLRDTLTVASQQPTEGRKTLASVRVAVTDNYRRCLICSCHQVKLNSLCLYLVCTKALEEKTTGDT